MSLIDAPMALLDRVRNHRDARADDPLVRRISATLEHLEPDPLFQRRVRAEAINGYLAAREVRAAGRTRREMGRLGRAVLYASFALTLSVTAVGAAAQQSLPGEALYGVKLRLEEIRIQIAPASLRPELAAMGLALRLAEAEELAARGDWAGVLRASAMVDRAAAELAAYGLGPATPGLAGLQHHTDLLSQIAADAPPAAQAGLQRAIEASSAAVQTGHPASTNAGGNHGSKGGIVSDGGSTPSPDAHDLTGGGGGEQSATRTPKADPSSGPPNDD